MEKPLVSIITPAFNSSKFIAETILSVQNQTYCNWEMIVVDDASTDNTSELVKELANSDHRIRLITQKENKGTGIARNEALDKAKGRYIAFLDADDLWKPEKLEKQLDFLTKNNLPFTFSFYDCIDENGDRIPQRIEAPKNLSYKKLFFCNYIGNLTGIYDVDFFGKIKIPIYRKRQDWMLWLSILKKIKEAKPVSESLAFYRIRKESLSSSKMSLLKYNFMVFNKFHQLN